MSFNASEPYLEGLQGHLRFALVFSLFFNDFPKGLERLCSAATQPPAGLVLGGFGLLQFDGNPVICLCTHGALPRMVKI